jgi:Na+/H+ antiporter NhaC
MFVELNVVAFLIILIVISYYTILSLFLKRFDVFVFLGGVVLSSMFYSTISEAFYAVIWITVIASLERTRSRMPDKGAAKPQVSRPVTIQGPEMVAHLPRRDM